MLNSRDINLLRPDVAYNCRKMIAIAASEGFPILVTGTVRDREFQEYSYSIGTSNSPVPSFHADYAGLAFDIAKNVKGHEYDDENFWRYCGALGKRMGFTWGGDWKSIVDKPHFQWDERGKYTSAMIRAKKFPAQMPAYKGEEKVSYEQFKDFMERYLDELKALPPSAWSEDDRAWAEEKGIIRGDENGDMQYKSFCTREQMVAFLHRAKEMK